jgi:putative ABC transport system permease protein
MSLFDLDHWHEIFQTLRRNKLRTFLTACGVFWGVFMLLVMLGFARGMETAIEEDFKLFAFNTVFVWGQQTGKPYAGRQPGRRVQLTLDDLQAIRQIDGVDVALSRNFFGGLGGRGVVSRGGKAGNFGVTAEEPDYLRLEALEVRRGRFLNPVDISEARKVAVIGPRVRDTLFTPGEDPIGQTVQVNRMILTVVGVYHTAEASGPRGDFFSGRVFMPSTTFARAFATGNRIGAIAVLVGDGRPSTEVENDVRTLLKTRHRIHPDDDRAIGGFNREKEFRKIANLFLAIHALSWFVGVLTLLAGAIGVSNIMMIAVAERTREIGIRKAVGASPISIMVQIVLESTVLTALAGYLAVVAGVGVIEVAGHIVNALPKTGGGPRLFAAPELELGKALLAAGVLTVAGALAGLAPARAAAAVRPVEALAHE